MVDIKKYWVGSTGPFTYDADVALPDRGTNLPAGVTNQSTLITTGQLNVATAPTDATHVLREDDIGGIVGDVVGPAAATDEAVARFDTVTGKLLQNSVVLIDNTGNVTGVVDLTASGDVKLATGKALIVNAIQVVSDQQAAVADATGAGDVVAQLNALLARLRTHGLIA